jgi:hypothetical protein
VRLHRLLSANIMVQLFIGSFIEGRVDRQTLGYHPSLVLPFFLLSPV